MPFRTRLEPTLVGYRDKEREEEGGGEKERKREKEPSEAVGGPLCLLGGW